MSKETMTMLRHEIGAQMQGSRQGGDRVTEIVDSLSAETLALIADLGLVVA